MEQNKSLETDPHKYLQILVFAKEQKGHNATRIVFSTTGARTTGYPCAKTELPSIILKYVKPKIAKFVKENIGKKFL